jgi:Cu+-exporting ATPase
VDALSKTGRFSFVKSARVGIRGIVEAIEQLGYTAIQSAADDDPSRPNAQMESLARTKEIMSWRTTFYNCLVFALPVSFISMGLPMIYPALVNYSLIPGLSLGNTAMLLLTIPIQFSIGKRFHVAAWKVRDKYYVKK